MKQNKRHTKKPFWVVRAGLQSAAHDLFMDRGRIVLMSQEMGDLRALPKDRQAFYEAYRSKHDSDGETAISGIGGKFFRFIHEMRVGDHVLYPCRLDKIVYFGVVTGPYVYDASQADFPHFRKVHWIASFPKKVLSLYSKRELNTARTFFCFKKNAEEIYRRIAAIKKGRK
jgi:restriction system protein